MPILFNKVDSLYETKQNKIQLFGQMKLVTFLIIKLKIHKRRTYTYIGIYRFVEKRFSLNHNSLRTL